MEHVEVPAPGALPGLVGEPRPKSGSRLVIPVLVASPDPDVDAVGPTIGDADPARRARPARWTGARRSISWWTPPTWPRSGPRETGRPATTRRWDRPEAPGASVVGFRGSRRTPGSRRHPPAPLVCLLCSSSVVAASSAESSSSRSAVARGLGFGADVLAGAGEEVRGWLTWTASSWTSTLSSTVTVGVGSTTVRTSVRYRVGSGSGSRAIVSTVAVGSSSGSGLLRTVW